MKKGIKVFLVLILTILLTGCGNKNYNKKDLESIKNNLLKITEYQKLKNETDLEENVKSNELIIDLTYDDNKYKYVYKLEDNHISVDIADSDYIGPSIYYSVLKSISKHLNVDSEDLINLVNAVSSGLVKSDSFTYKENEKTYTLDLLLKNDYDFSVLKDMKIEEEDYEYYTPLTEEHETIVLNKGDMLIRINGNEDEAYFLYAQKGEFSSSTLDNLYVTISYFLPNKQETFKEYYKSIKSISFDKFDIKVNARDELKDYVDEDKVNKYNVISITYTK